MPKSNVERQRDYYSDPENKLKVLRNRHLRAIAVFAKNKKGKVPSPKTIHRYNLVKEAKEAGIPTDLPVNPSPNQLSAPVENKLTKELEKKVKAKLDAYDGEIKKLIQTKQQAIRNTVKGRPRKSGNLSLADGLELLGQVPVYKQKTIENHQRNLKLIIEYILKRPKESNIVGAFNDHSRVMNAIKNAKQKTNQSKSYADLSLFYNIPVTMSDNIPEFRQQLTKKAYDTYKDAFKMERNIGEDRRRQIRDAETLPDISQLHLVRKFYANDKPASLEHLLTSLYTLRPALRNDYGCIRLIFGNKKIERELFENNNWYNVDKGTLIIQHYKTDKKYGRIVTKLDKRLRDVIDIWLKKSGNKAFLITKSNGGSYADCDNQPPTQPGQVGDLVAKAFNRYLQEGDDKSIGIKRIRQIHANHVATMKNVKEQTEYTNQMAHTLDTSRTVYRRKNEGLVAESLKPWSFLKDYGEKGYPWADKQILEGIDLDANRKPKNLTGKQKEFLKKSSEA